MASVKRCSIAARSARNVATRTRRSAYAFANGFAVSRALVSISARIGSDSAPLPSRINNSARLVMSKGRIE